ncbi:exopolysaccharide biosynthesis polyprenyl glycosylphosphotransferase [Psychromicrobium silvestre]|uniref:exopolysaccharide biosynthesis polyprenyl glycosylphosphotransferase n=1 Tax=Psychromicrobium silvestre TaxID=1645614 RepID=UPI001C5352BD
MRTHRTAPLSSFGVPEAPAANGHRRSSGRFVELLVVLDLSVVAVVILGSLIWPFANFREFWLTLAAAAMWLTCLAGIRGFSMERAALPRPTLSVWAASLVMAIVSLINLVFGQQIPLARLTLTLLALTALDVLGRFILKQFRGNHVVSVVTAESPLEDSSGSRRAVHTFMLSQEQLAQPEEFIRRLSQYIKFTKATAVELPLDLQIDRDLIDRLSWELRKMHVTIRMVSFGHPISTTRTRTRTEGNKLMVEIDAPYQHLGTRAGKRVMDIVGSGLLILVFSPLLAVLALIVKLSSSGPVFYKQERIGIDEQPFNILKFRSMVVGADAQLQALLKAQGSADKPLFKVDSDPRITRIGGVMRRLSLDELPQLFNVFGGSMSLVGPRPQRPAEVALYDQTAKQRLGVLPGMTGMWQISGRSRLSWEEAIMLDRYYAQNWSLAQDLRILARTVSAVVRGDGAV